MPDIDFFRGQEVQTMLSDVLMVYCKSPEGKSLGYRQGLHEIAAVLLWVVWHDAVKRTSDNHEDGEKAGEKDGEKDGENEGEREDEDVVATVLDAKFIEHDAWALFRAVMAHAREWYEPGTEGQSGSSAIIAKSKYIHETLLMATDPELAQHLKALDVLPQVFLM